MDVFDCKLKIWLPIGRDGKFECLEWMTCEETAVAAVGYLSSHRVPSEASREVVDIISADYSGYEGGPVNIVSADYSGYEGGLVKP